MSKRSRHIDEGGPKPRVKRPWERSLVIALAVVGGSVTLSVVVNPLLGRTIHWDWTAALAVTLLVGLTMGLRNRWV